MAKKKGLKVCPNCGSHNLHLEGYVSKGRQIIECNECDEVFEIFAGRSHDHNRSDSGRDKKGAKYSPEDADTDGFDSDYNEDEIDFDDGSYEFEEEEGY